MINILIIKSGSDIMTIEATGHSGYAESGKDIVCSAVSSLMQSLAVGLTDVVKIPTNIKVDEEFAHMHIEIQDKHDSKMRDAQILMHTTALSLRAVADGYTKYIKIKEKQQ